MASRIIRLALAFINLFLLVCSRPLTVAAQDNLQVWLSPPDISDFPRISAYLSVRDSQGNYIADLTAAEVSVLEDGLPLPVSELYPEHAGVQLVTAINPGPPFAIRDSQGFTRADRLVKALLDWARNRSGSNLDDLSLLTSDGSLTPHLTSLDEWAEALQSYQPDSRNATPTYDILTGALELAADQTPRPGMGRAVLFVTALPSIETGIGLQSLAARASQLGIRVFVWLIDSPSEFTSPQAHSLANLAAQTSGSFFGYSGVEDIPDPEIFLEPLRNAYYLAYASSISTAGTHRLGLQVRSPAGEFSTPEQEFDLRLSPPNIAFISPRLEILRTAQTGETSGDPASRSDVLMPSSQEMELLIEFPDGYPRSLVRTTLYVDGAIAAENMTEPFDRFTWDLSAYTATGSHTLKAEALDSQGLSSTSIDLNISIKVEPIQGNRFSPLSQGRQLLVGLVVVMAGAVLLLVLVIGGRLQPGSLRSYRLKAKSAARRKDRRKDPVTQPVTLKGEPELRTAGWINRLHWPQRRFTPKASAHLVRFTDNEQDTSTPPIPVSGSEITFGSDPTQATQVLEDPSVDALHARLCQEENGAFRLSDEGSTAGTWINYTPISAEGMLLEHGDLIHIGRVGFRFVVRAPENTRKPVIIPKANQP